MSQPTAKVILDSIQHNTVTPSGSSRLTTMEVKLHRFVLAELNTHRDFSRNSASSRAIPYEKVRNRVVEDPAYPLHWGKEQKGMQSGSVFEAGKQNAARAVWHDAMQNAVNHADMVNELGLHKSLVNRLLEPFMWHTVIISSTRWHNFFKQRLHPDAQPEMRAAAVAMYEAYNASVPKQIGYGQWHTPYITDEDREEVVTLDTQNGFRGIAENFGVSKSLALIYEEALKQVSVARCARVSYLTHDGKRNLLEDLKLYARLKGSGHWSPFEHVATPVSLSYMGGNFGPGWRQYRKDFRQERVIDPTPNNLNEIITGE